MMLSIALAGLAGWTPPSWGAPALSVKRRELMEVQRQLEVKKKEIDEFRKQESLLKRDLSSLETLNSDSSRKIRALQARIRESESRKSALKARLGALQLAEGKWRGVLSDELRGYQRGQGAQFAFFGGGELWEEAFRRAAILEKLHYLDEVRGFQRRTEADEAQVRRVAADLQAKSQGARAEQRTRRTLYEQKKGIYQETRGRLLQTEKNLRELQDSAVALTRLLRALETKSPYKMPGGPVPLAEPRHSLPWPAAGKVISSFGRRNVKELNTWVIQQGIRLSTVKDAPVHPVKPGRVIFAGPFRSYGQVLIVDHGQAFYTIYGQLGSPLKKKGDSVQRSDTIATAGPGPDGGVLYFELRQSGDALDPMEWLEHQ